MTSFSVAVPARAGTRFDQAGFLRADLKRVVSTKRERMIGGVDLGPHSADDRVCARPPFSSGLGFFIPKLTLREIEMMHKRLLIVPVMSMVVAAASGAAPQKTSSTSLAEGFVPLFNGKDFTGWHGLKTMDPRKFEAMTADEKTTVLDEGAEDLKKHWRVEDGVIINDGQGVYLTTDKNYGDVELLVDFKIGPKGDSGVYLRGTPQVQIWDFTDPNYIARLQADKGSGGLWNNSPGAAGKDPLVRADNPIGEWNTFRIIQVGTRTTIYLNGKLVVDHAILENYWNRALPIPARGPIQLQTHDHELRCAQYRRPRNHTRGSQPNLGEARRRGFPLDLQWTKPRRLGRSGRELRGQERHLEMQGTHGRHDLLQRRADRFHGPGRVQASPWR